MDRAMDISRIVYQKVKLDYDAWTPMKHDPKTNPVVFIPGLFSNKIMFEDVLKALSEKSCRKVYSVDLRCQGKSPFADFSNIHDLVMDVKKFMEDTHIDRAAIVGHSGGAVLGHILSLDKPDAVEKLVMIDHLPDCVIECTPGFSLHHDQFEAHSKILKLLKLNSSLAQERKKLLHLADLSSSPSQKALLKKASVELTTQNGKFQWITDQRFILEKSKTLLTYRQPGKIYLGDILLIRALDSSITTDESVEDAKKLNPRMTVKTYETGGHLLLLELPERFVEDVTCFLNSSK